MINKTGFLVPLIAAAFLLGGCLAHLSKSPASMVGQSAAQLQKDWGKPDSTQESDGETIFSYKSSRTAEPVGSAPMCLSDNRVGSSIMHCDNDIFPKQQAELYCDTTFTLHNNVVTSWQQSGNACP